MHRQRRSVSEFFFVVEEAAESCAIVASMPEGDTIHRLAGRLQPLVGQTFTEVESRTARIPERMILGARVAAVRAYAKHLFIDLDSDERPAGHLHIHLGMTGRVRLADGGRRPREDDPDVRCFARAGDRSLFILRTRTAAFLIGPQAEAIVARLGPDLLADEFDVRAAAARLREEGGTALGEALLDQTRVAGLGNEYRSELPFLVEWDPRAPVVRVPLSDLEILLRHARRIMVRSVARGQRVFRPAMGRRGGRTTWVYGHAGTRCLRCGERIEMERDTKHRRILYFCPGCQLGPQC